MIIKMFGKIRMFYNIEIVYTLINSLYYTKLFYIIKIVVLIINSLILYKQFFPYEIKNIRLSNKNTKIIFFYNIFYFIL